MYAFVPSELKATPRGVLMENGIRWPCFYALTLARGVPRKRQFDAARGSQRAD
jgi:hypothetical protein